MKKVEPTERDQRILDWTKKKHKRKKVTPEDVDETFSRWKAKLSRGSDKPSTLTLGDYLRRIVIVVCLLATIGLTLLFLSHERVYNTTRAQNIATIQQLSKQVAKLRGDQKVTPTVEPKQAFGAVDEAEKAVNDVARLQSEYVGIVVGTEVVDGKAVVTGVDDIKRINASLRPFFTEASRQRGFDPAQQWYEMTVRGVDGTRVPAPKGSYVWEPQRVLDPADGMKIPVLWLARDTKTHELLGWAKAVYVAADKKFDTVSVALTVQGQERLGVSDSGVDGTTSQAG